MGKISFCWQRETWLKQRPCRTAWEKLEDAWSVIDSMLTQALALWVILLHLLGITSLLSVELRWKNLGRHSGSSLDFEFWLYSALEDPSAARRDCKNHTPVFPLTSDHDARLLVGAYPISSHKQPTVPLSSAIPVIDWWKDVVQQMSYGNGSMKRSELDCQLCHWLAVCLFPHL